MAGSEFPESTEPAGRARKRSRDESAAHSRMHLAERLHEARQTVRWLRIGFAGASALALAALAAGGALVLDARRDAAALRVDLAEQTRRAAELGAEHAEAQREIEMLVRGRIPGLQAIAFDRVIKIDTRYARNLVFTETRRGGERRYEYKMVLENRSDSLLTPNVRLYLFDRVGVQLGVAEIASTYSITEADIVTLAPHEVRSFTAEIELDRPEAEPLYYLLRVE